jgi:hypothetical protein
MGTTDMEAIKDAQSEQSTIHFLPKENTSGCVTEIPVTVIKRWVNHLTDDTLCGNISWILQNGRAELHLADEMLFIIGILQDGIMELEITTTIEKWVSAINHHPQKEYRTSSRFFTKKIKPGELLYQEYIELLNLARASVTGKINGDKNLVFNIADTAIMSSSK